jgi:hypothetical protein
MALHVLWAPTIIPLGNTEKVMKQLHSKFPIIGSTPVEVKNNCSGDLSTNATIPDKLIFKGANILKEKALLPKKYLVTETDF